MSESDLLESEAREAMSQPRGVKGLWIWPPRVSLGLVGPSNNGSVNLPRPHCSAFSTTPQLDTLATGHCASRPVQTYCAMVLESIFTRQCPISDIFATPPFLLTEHCHSLPTFLPSFSHSCSPIVGNSSGQQDQLVPSQLRSRPSPNSRGCSLQLRGGCRD